MTDAGKLKEQIDENTRELKKLSENQSNKALILVAVIGGLLTIAGNITTGFINLSIEKKKQQGSLIEKVIVGDQAATNRNLKLLAKIGLIDDVDNVIMDLKDHEAPSRSNSSGSRKVWTSVPLNSKLSIQTMGSIGSQGMVLTHYAPGEEKDISVPMLINEEKVLVMGEGGSHFVSLVIAFKKTAAVTVSAKFIGHKSEVFRVTVNGSEGSIEMVRMLIVTEKSG